LPFRHPVVCHVTARGGSWSLPAVFLA
jgi:hypothetical protein